MIGRFYQIENNSFQEKLLHRMVNFVVDFFYLVLLVWCIFLLLMYSNAEAVAMA